MIGSAPKTAGFEGEACRRKYFYIINSASGPERGATKTKSRRWGPSVLVALARVESRLSQVVAATAGSHESVISIPMISSKKKSSNNFLSFLGSMTFDIALIVERIVSLSCQIYPNLSSTRNLTREELLPGNLLQPGKNN